MTGPRASCSAVSIMVFIYLGVAMFKPEWF